MISADTIAILIDAGLSGETLKKVVVAIERDVTLACYAFERNSVTDVTRNVTGCVTPAALRMRKMRERKSLENNVLDVEKTASVVTSERNSVTPESVTSYNNNISSSTEQVEEKNKNIVRNVTRKRNSYADDFEKFWTAFPTDAGMSKLEAAKAWDRLSPDDRLDAFNAIPAFKAWVAQQGENYRTVHACRYLSQRRFEGFKEKAERMKERVSTGFYIQPASDEMHAWDGYLKQTTGRPCPRDSRGGWTQPTRWPPGYKPHAEEQDQAA